MNDPTATPVEETLPFIQARKAMDKDAEELIAILLKQVNIRAEYYEPAENLHYVNADRFLLDLVVEKLQERG